jgi:hypothetical protein
VTNFMAGDSFPALLASWAGKPRPYPKIERHTR